MLRAVETMIWDGWENVPGNIKREIIKQERAGEKVLEDLEKNKIHIDKRGLVDVEIL